MRFSCERSLSLCICECSVSELIMESWLNRLPNLEVVLVKADNAITLHTPVVSCGDTIEAIKVFKKILDDDEEHEKRPKLDQYQLHYQMSG